MSLELGFATLGDAPRIAEIHMAAFGPNAMLRAQFPSPAIRQSLQTSIELKTLADINDDKITVLVVRDDRKKDHDPVVVAFAKWSHPIQEGDNYKEQPWVWPQGTNHGVLDDWTRTTELGEERVLAGKPSYHLTFTGTDPRYERRGAGSMLVRWGKEQSRMHCVPLYLESTLEAVPFYTRHGFNPELRLSLSYKVGCKTETYEEMVFMFGRDG